MKESTIFQENIKGKIYTCRKPKWFERLKWRKDHLEVVIIYDKDIVPVYYDRINSSYYMIYRNRKYDGGTSNPYSFADFCYIITKE